VLLAGRYQLEERVGSGGMGQVWRAVDQLLGRAVAVKLMRQELVAEPGFAERFLAEARTMATIKHRGVVAVYDYYGDATGAFLVMEYVAGESLSARLHRVGRLDPARAMTLLAQAAEALQAAHDKGVVHRDIKPGNLLVADDDTLVLTDFGIARSASSTPVTATGAVIGTPAYLAPEQVLGKPATARSDLYALGVVGYECLTGRRPFEADNPFEIAMKRLHGPPPTISAYAPPAVVAVIERALAPDPDQRWQSAAEFATVARQAAQPGASPPPPPLPPPPALPPTRQGFFPGRASLPAPVAPASPPAPVPGPPPVVVPQPPAGRPQPTSYPPATAPPAGYPSPPPPWAGPPTRPLTVLTASILLCMAAGGLLLYSALTVLVLEDAIAITAEVYGRDFEEFRGAMGGGVLLGSGLLAILGLLFLLLAAQVAGGRGGSRGWTFVLAFTIICCAGPCWWLAGVETLAAGESTAELGTRLAEQLPPWYQPLVNFSITVTLVALLVTMVLLVLPPTNRYFRRPAPLYYPYPYPYYGYPPHR
jgi:serine/threonine-protein kinase